MGHVTMFCTGWILDRSPHTKYYMIFVKIMDPGKWDIIVRYQVTQYRRVFRRLIVGQLTLGFWGVTELRK